MSIFSGYAQTDSTWSQFKQGFKLGSVAGCGATQQPLHRHLETFGSLKYVTINGVALNKVQRIHLHLGGVLSARW